MTMKKIKYIYQLVIMSAVLFLLPACDKGFEDLNKNPYALTTLDPALLFANAIRTTHTGSWEGEQTIVQQFVNAYNLGATTAFNFNEDNDNFNNPKWNTNYPNTIKLLTQAQKLASEQANRTNLQNMIRIWKAYTFMTMVDTYGDVPYKEAGNAYLQAIFYPKYDKDSDIYADLYNELKAAAGALSSSADYVKEDLLYGSSGNATAQTTKWKKLANSLLLRLGMRYSKVDAAKAQSIVKEAVAAGVITENTDDAYLVFTAVFNNPLNAGPRGTNPYYYYLAEPFVDFLKNNKDPRMVYIAGKYADPNLILSTKPDTSPEKQFGFPIGFDQTSVLKMPGYRGTAGTGQNYSQINYEVLGSATAPAFYVTNAQTKLLLAEAALKGWVTGSAKDYYEQGIRADMASWALFPNVPKPAISEEQIKNYLAEPGIAYNEAKALEQINTQYWLVNITNGAESFANFRRSGYPALKPNSYNGNLSGGFARRMAYPNNENSQNSQNYLAASARIGGDNLVSRVFWDAK